MRKLVLLALIAGALGLFAWSELPKDSSAPVAAKKAGSRTEEALLEPQADAAQAPRQETEDPAPAQAALQESPSWPTPQDYEGSEPVDQAAPALSEIREEAQHNPHATPPSLLGYAALMSERMEAALSSKEAAEKLFPQLESCVIDDAGRQAPQIRMVCLVNAHRLAGRHPSLSARFEELSRKDPSLAAMMEMTGLSEME